LKINDNLSNIRKILEKNDVQMNMLLFAKIVEGEFYKIQKKEEKTKTLNSIIHVVNKHKILHLIRNPIPDCSSLNNLIMDVL